MTQGIDTHFDKADARLAQQKAEEIERLKQEKKQARLAKKRAKEQKERSALRAKFIAPIILFLSLIISYLIWQSK